MTPSATIENAQYLLEGECERALQVYGPNGALPIYMKGHPLSLSLSSHSLIFVITHHI